MHEIGVLYQVVTEVEKVARENKIVRIEAIVLQIGELSGMLPKFFEQYYDMVIENKPLFEGSEIIIEILPGMAICKSCNNEYNVAANEGICPECSCNEKNIISGREFIIKEILLLEKS